MQIVLSMEFKSVEEKNHVCNFCGKRFSSGKALGGHKRFHIQQERLAAAAVASASAGNKTQESGNNNNIRSRIKGENSMLCCICHKYFPSMKSLSGHMRTHRDRNWKGIQPPVSETLVSDRLANGSPSTDSITTVDLLQSLSSSWSETGRRGRKGDPTLAAAVDLINLSRSQDRVLRKQPDQVKADSSPTSVSGDGTDYNSDPKKYARVNDLKRKNMMMKNSVSVSSSSNSTETDDGNKDEKSVSNNKKLKIRFSTTNTTATAATYKCSSCDKSFSTFQALGGHRSTHNKDNKKHSSATTIDTKKKDDNDDVEVAKTMKRTKFYGIGVEVAKSSMCNGGGELQIMASSSSSQVDHDHLVGRNGNTTKITGRRPLMLDIDLNQMPCAVMADDVTDA
ncbi:zinc finger protein ZAT9-like [Humulus lupulus]|uniref:zinc finger protein ZAT9-like n=1 Tax=Humulus lupulus TaxID=3486 RepID=UPI002B410513|nr:zinc finger protein ZAT9-like [Humulus lupulus]